MALINCEKNIFLNCSPTFAITDKKLYVSVVTLSTKGNAKLLHQLKPGLKRAPNWNKYQSKAQNQYLDYVTDPGFYVANTLFLSCEDNAHQRSYK